MHELINNLLAELSNATVRESKKTAIQFSLFYDEFDPPLEFNGYNCPAEYDKYSNNLYVNFQNEIIQSEIAVEEKLILLSELKFRVEDFGKRYFPEDDIEFVFARIKAVRVTSLQNYPKERIKGKTLLFLNIQHRLLQRISRFISNLISKTKNKPIITRGTLPPLFQESYDQERISAVSFDKLRVFNKNTGTTHLIFNGSKVDMEVLVHMMHFGKVFTYPNGKSATKPELRELFCFLGNTPPAKNPAATLYHSKERLEKEAHIFTRLSAAYEDLKEEEYIPKSPQKKL